MRVLNNAGWKIKMNDAVTETTSTFAGCIPFKHLFGFGEDYGKILVDCNQQLILNRSNTDFDSIHVSGTGIAENVALNKNFAIELSKVIWKMPIVRVNDKEKLKLLKVVDSRRSLTCAFRTWDLCEYPILPQNSSHSWTVKSSNLLEKPRLVIVGFQTDRKDNLLKHSGYFDHCNLINLKVYLNSEAFPYEDFRADFKKNKTGVLYKAYTDFQKSYYNKDVCEPLLTKEDFQQFVPIVVVDLTRQNDAVKSSTVDLRIEFETSEAIPAKTTAYCLILHDQIITYNPFNGDVRKM